MRIRRGQYAKTRKRRRQIIEAALACFTEMGFLDTTMGDIRIRSNASNGSIYHHFRGKDQLAAAVYLEGLTEWQEAMVAQLEEHPGALEGVYAMVRCHLSWVREHPDWIRYIFQMRHAGFMTGELDSVAEQNKRFVQGLTQWLDPHVERGTFRRLPAELYVSLIIQPWTIYKEVSQTWLNINLCIAPIGNIQKFTCRGVWHRSPSLVDYSVNRCNSF